MYIRFCDCFSLAYIYDTIGQHRRYTTETHLAISFSFLSFSSSGVLVLVVSLISYNKHIYGDVECECIGVEEKHEERQRGGGTERENERERERTERTRGRKRTSKNRTNNMSKYIRSICIHTYYLQYTKQICEFMLPTNTHTLSISYAREFH